MERSTADAFEALAECCDELVFITELSMRMVYASARFERETGFTVEDFQFPQADNPFIHREDAEEVAQRLGAFVTSSAVVSDPIINRFLDRWGNTHRYRTIVTKITYRDSPALLFVCRLIETPSADTTDVRQYRALVESSEDAIVRLDSGGRFLFVNRSTYHLLGYSAVELGRMRLDDIVIPRDVLTFTTELARAVATARPTRFEIHVTTKGGRVLRLNATLTSLGRFGQVGELLAVLRPGCHADVLERAR